MKTFGLSGIAIVAVGFFVLASESIYAQYLPPVIGNAFQSGPIPDFIYPEKKSELQPIQPNQHSQFIYREYATDELQVSPIQYQIILTPIADSRPGAVQQQPRATLPASSSPQQVSGMTAETIYYFPPPTFPDPVPITVYRPTAPQQSNVPTDAPTGLSQVPPQNWSPYNSMLYAPPMVTQPHHFGPPKQDRGRRAPNSRNYGEPGQPVVGPPTLVYPNGIVVRPKVYLPQQPFKNVVRAITP